MAKRGENIHQRKDGRWEARILIRDAAGQARYHSVYGKTYKEAKEKKILYLSQSQPADGKKKNVAFEEILISWLESRYFYQKKSTRLKYYNVINAHIIPDLGKMNVNQIDDVTINHFLAEKKETGRLDGCGGLSNSYIKTMAIIISSSISYAAEKGVYFPIKSKIRKPPVSKNEISILSYDMQKKFENSLQCDNSLTALGTLIVLNTGLRIGEICALRWEDVDLTKRIIRVRHSIVRILSQDSAGQCSTELIMDIPKSRTSIRDIPITTKLFPILSKAFESASSKFVISDNSDFVKPRTFEYRFHRILSQYEIPDINFHALRHTFATRCVEMNIDIKTLSEILGHANVGITLNTYVHPSFETKRRQLEKLCSI